MIPITALLIAMLWNAIANYPPNIASLDFQDGELEVATGSPTEFVGNRQYRWITRPEFEIVISNSTRITGTYEIQVVVEKTDCGKIQGFEIRSQNSLEVISNRVDENKQIFKLTTVVKGRERQLLRFHTKSAPCIIATDSRSFYGKLTSISSQRIEKQ